MILPMDRLEDLCQRMKVRIGILTVPGEHPEGILVQNENMAVSLAILSNHLKERFSTK